MVTAKLFAAGIGFDREAILANYDTPLFADALKLETAFATATIFLSAFGLGKFEGKVAEITDFAGNGGTVVVLFNVSFT